MSNNKVTHIIVDVRELRSPVAKELERLDCELQFETMEVSDYCVSDRMAFERKTASDFLQDWIDSRQLFSKLIDLKMAYTHPILLLEGYTHELFELRMIDPMKVQSCLFTIARLGIPMIETINAKGTAMALQWFANKEQNDGHRLVSWHGKRSSLSDNEKLEYVISSIPGIGRQTAIDLLRHFGNIEEICKSGISDLVAVDGIGEKTACNIRNITSMRYKT